MALTREQLEALYRESVAKVSQAPQPGAPVQQGMDNLSFFENYSKQMGLDSAPQKGWGIGSALKSGYANIAQGKANVALMDAKVAEAKGDLVTADNLKKRAAELGAKAQSQMPEAYKDPEGVSGFAHDVVQSVPFSGKSMLINTLARAGGSLAARGASALAGAAMGSAVGPIGTAAGGLVGALIPGLAALYTSNEESSQNKADAFNSLIAKGVDPIQAEKEAFWKTYVPSMAVTAPLDFLTGGLWTWGKKIMSEAGEQVTKRAAQEMMENAAQNIDKSNDPELQIAMTLMGFDGRVIATVGSSNKKTEALSWDRATMSSLQPGSSIKPVVVYPYAIDNKMLYFSSQIEDAPLEKYETNEYGELVSGPKNWYEGYKGTMLLPDAIEISSNATAAQVMDKITPAAAYKQVTQLMGFTHLDEQDGKEVGA